MTARLPAATLGFWALALAFAGIITIANFNEPVAFVSLERDVWHHLAVLGELMKDPFNAANPHVMSEAPSRSYMPWFVFVAWFSKALGLTPEQALGVSGLLSLLALAGGIFAFTRRYFSDARAPLIFFVVFLFSWFYSFGHTGFHTLKTFVFSPGWPFAIVLAAGFWSWTLALAFIERKTFSPWPLAGIALLAAFAFLTHPLQGGFAVAMTGCIALCHRAGGFRKAVMVGGAILAGLALCRYWIYFDPYSFLAELGTRENEIGGKVFSRRFKEEFFLISGLALLGPAGFYVYGKGGWRRELVVAALAMALAFIAAWMMGVWIYFRFYPLLVIVLQLGLCWLALAFLDGKIFGSVKPDVRVLALVAAGLALGAVHVRESYDLYAKSRAFINSDLEVKRPTKWMSRLPAVREALRRLIPADAVTMAQAETAYPVESVGRKVVAIPRLFVLTPDMDERHAAIRRFFEEDATRAERDELIARYHVGFIFYRDRWTSPALQAALAEYGEETRLHGLTLVRIAAADANGE